MKLNLEFPGRERLEELLFESRTRTLSAVQRKELNAILRADEAARSFAAQTLMDDAALAEELRAEQMESLLAADSGGMLGATQHSPAATRRTWLQWRPLAAAAAGIVLGIFCTSVVLAYVAPSLGKVVTLLDDSFESGPAPLATGVPTEPGRWSGDFTEVMGEQQGVKPENGGKMLRFVSTEAADAGAAALRVSVAQVVDLRRWRETLREGSAVVNYSAAFNGTAEADPAKTTYRIDVRAYAGDLLVLQKPFPERASQEVAHSLWRTDADFDPASWQRVSGSLIPPPEADFLLIELKIFRPARGGATQTAGSVHYVDDVRMSLVTPSGSKTLAFTSPTP